ncbi:unnamed protein product [Phytophthora lilii]|uniref:Unnamed protein product n=1 Tax=Phytophthora lilii TaxID=2077276 RepID=A0A9W6YEV0_9STRA|nr:unnamed protein product [Phytophthora lilii]
MSSDLRWRAPESLTRRPTIASDVYSFVMCIIEAATGEPPFSYLSEEDVCRNLQNGVLPEQSDDVEDEAWELVIEMTNLDHLINKLNQFASKCGSQYCVKEQSYPIVDFPTIGGSLSIDTEQSTASSVSDIVETIRAGNSGELETAVLLFLQALVHDNKTWANMR